jgi:site-specific recombinase XerD
MTGPIHKNTLRSYESVITPFCRDHGNLELEGLTVDLIRALLESITTGRKTQTRKIRFAHLTSFFNFVHNNLSPDFQNPFNSPMLRKLFRPQITTNWNIIEKDTVDEITFRSDRIRNRLILELMTRGGMRIGEVLKLTANASRRGRIRED